MYLLQVRDPKVVRDVAKARARVDLLVEALVRTHGVIPHAVVLIPPRTVPKTTSGKIARSRAQRAFLGDPQSEEDRLQVLYQWHQGEASVDVERLQAAVVNTPPPAADHQDNWNRNDELLASAEAQRLLAALKEEVVVLLPEDAGVTAEGVDAQRSLLQLGMDSMLLEQFRSVLETDFKLDTAELDPEMLCVLASFVMQ